MHSHLSFLLPAKTAWVLSLRSPTQFPVFSFLFRFVVIYCLFRFQKIQKMPSSLRKNPEQNPEPEHIRNKIRRCPPGSPFEGGVFLLHVFLPCSYPLSCPNISFQTPVYHPNISESGQICMHLLQEWSPSTTVPKALEAIRYLLAQPDTDEALRQWIAEEVLAHRRHGEDTDDGKRYVDHARAQTEREASKNVEEWKAIWKLGNDDDNAS